MNLLDVMSRQHSPDVSKVLLEGFFAQVVARANLPDCYDETLEGKTDCSDVLHFMALVAGDCRRTVEVTRQLLAQPANQEASMDVMHVALSFAAELVEVNNFASSLAPTVCTALPGLSSPLLVADSLRFLQRLLRRTGGSFSRLPPEDVEHIFRALLAALRWAADPDVCRVSLAILSLLSQYPGAFVLFQSHFQAFNDADLPLDLTTGFCSAWLRNEPRCLLLQFPHSSPFVTLSQFLAFLFALHSALSLPDRLTTLWLVIWGGAPSNPRWRTPGRPGPKRRTAAGTTLAA